MSNLVSYEVFLMKRLRQAQGQRDLTPRDDPAGPALIVPLQPRLGGRPFSCDTPGAIAVAAKRTE